MRLVDDAAPASPRGPATAGRTAGGAARVPTDASADVARLLAADSGVPGLQLLLDDDALSDWVAGRLGPAAVAGGARRTYLRWKPGAGGVARVRLGARGGDLLLAVWHRDSAAKLHKTLLRGGRAVLVVDERLVAVLAHPAADRDLPGLGRLHARGANATLRRLVAEDLTARRVLHRAAGAEDRWATLAWKPQRRWVGLVGDGREDPDQVVLRACRPDVADGAAVRYATVAPLLPGAVPRLLGSNTRRGLVAVEHVPGTGLDTVLRLGTDGSGDRGSSSSSSGGGGGSSSSSGSSVVGAGELVARLHAAGSCVRRPRADDPAGTAGATGATLASFTWREERDSLRDVADMLDLLLPDAGAGRLVVDLVGALPELPDRRRVLVHGDLSADQVVVRPDGRVALIDLDEVAFAPASVDLAAVAAAWWASDPLTAAGHVRALHQGYSRVRELPGHDDLRVRTAAHLLRRAAEPFRSGGPDWPGRVRRTVEAARAVLTAGPLAGAS